MSALHCYHYPIQSELKIIFVFKKRQTGLSWDFSIGKPMIRLQGSRSFKNLSFEQQGNKALIEAGGEALAEFRGIQANDLNRASFV